MNPNQPVYPSDRGGSDNGFRSPTPGLNIRSYIAIEMMKEIYHPDEEKEDMAKKAYELADALIAESNKKNEPDR